MAIRRRILDAALAAMVAACAVLVVATAIRDADPAAALKHSTPQSRLRRDPLDLAALRGLALTLDEQGHPDQADRLLSFVASRTWRDPATDAWLIRRRLAQGRVADAFRYVDALLRQDTGDTARQALFPLLIAAAGPERTQAPLEARLALSPPWRADFLPVLAAKGDLEGATAVFLALAKGPAPPTPAEYAPLIQRIVATGEIPAALATWRAVAGPRAPRGDLRDGDFTATPDGTPFTWRSAEGAGAFSAVEAAPGDPGREALRVEYDGFSSPTLPGQLMALAPGAYRITWREHPDAANAGALAWRVRCDDGAVLAERPAAGGGSVDANGWRAATLEARVPDTGCAGQWLELAAAPGERRNPVTVWFEHFMIAPEAGPPPTRSASIS